MCKVDLNDATHQVHIITGEDQFHEDDPDWLFHVLQWVWPAG